MSAQNVEIVRRFAEIFTLGDMMVSVNDPGRTAEIGAAITEIAEPDFESAMVGPAYMSTNRQLTGRGPDGLRELWNEWMTPFDSFRLEPQEIVEAGDKVLIIARQTGVTKTGGVEIESEAAAVFTIRNGRIARVEFHLDVREARDAAGLDPQGFQS
jgi:ketosteroid isomerase-like protein